MTEPSTLAGALAGACRRWPDRVALVCGDARMTYAELEREIGALAGAYRRIGVGRGDRVACSTSNRPEYLVALGAAWACGAVHAGVDFESTASELSHVARLTEARALVYEPPPGGDAAATLQDELHVIPVPFEPLTRAEVPPDSPAPEDPALIFVTSGTTGRAKATTGYHGNLSARWTRLAGWLRFTPEDVHLAQLPLSHGFGLMMAVSALLSGGRLVLVDGFSTVDALRIVEEERVTVLNGAPAHFKLLLSRLDPGRHDVSSLRLSVGTAAVFPPDLIRAIWDRLGVDFMFMYGSSEGVGVATTDREDMLLGSVGRPAPGSVEIVDAERRPLLTGEVGEIAFSRKVFPVRYWRGSAPEPGNADWYYSGDLGRVDEDGRLYVLGRLKHQIDRGGLKVDPVEVEGALLRCETVADAAVIGVLNPVLGETVCACIVPAAGVAPTLDDLRVALGRELAPYKLPEELRVLDEIPRTRIGKVDLDRLRALAALAA